MVSTRIIPEDIIKILGFVFDFAITWKSHIDMIVFKSKSCMPQLYRLCQFLDFDGLSFMYKTFRMIIYCTTEQLTLIFVDWILSNVVLKVCFPPLFLHYPPIFKLLLLALFVNCLMVRVKVSFSPFVHISPSTVLEDFLVCPLPTIPLKIAVWLFLDLSSLWADIYTAGVCLLFRLGIPYLLLC